jgi:hypothetical protein
MIKETIIKEDENIRKKKGAAGMLCQMSNMGSFVLEFDSIENRITSITTKRPTVSHLRRPPDAWIS